MKECPKCGTLLLDNCDICEHCGLQMVDGAEDTIDNKQNNMHVPTSPIAATIKSRPSMTANVLAGWLFPYVGLAAWFTCLVIGIDSPRKRSLINSSLTTIAIAALSAFALVFTSRNHSSLLSQYWPLLLNLVSLPIIILQTGSDIKEYDKANQ